MGIKIGDIYNKLKVVKLIKTEKSKNGGNRTWWLCKCLANGLNCKKEIILPSRNLLCKYNGTCGDATCSSHFQNLLGQRFGKLMAVRWLGSLNLYGYLSGYWECECECGNYTKARTSELTKGERVSCGCAKIVKGEEHWKYDGFKDITGSWFSARKNGAKQRGIKFILTKEELWNKFIAQNKLCLLTGLPIEFKNDTVSIDRIDSKKDYAYDNIQLVHKWINIMKNIMPLDVFISMCHLISTKNVNTLSINNLQKYIDDKIGK